jgi:rare lipoprotein A
MRLPDSRIAVSLAALLSAGGLAAQVGTGPAADYPVVIGAPYTVEGTTFAPIDTLNYDAVGRVLIGQAGGTAITGAHHTLPIPCYVEVTSLDSGRTVLVRLDRRGPMNATNLIELSPGAAAQLGIAGQDAAAVRVRRVNPPEVERAMLRAGGPAPVRMDTPIGLVGVLKRKLDQLEGKAAAPQLAAAQSSPVTAPVQPTTPPRAEGRPVPPATPKPVLEGRGTYVVQVGAFARKPNASKAARQLGTEPEMRGKLWRVRLGPFADKAAANAALAKARAAGFSDATIQRGG